MVGQKEVKVKVATKEDLSGVEAIENRINKIKQEQIQLRLNAKTEQLDQANQRIEYLKRTIAGLEAVPPHLGIEIDESEVQALKTELASLEHKTAQLQLDVEKGELEATKSEIEALDGEEIEIQLRNQSAMEAIDQIGQGFDRLKQGASEVGQQMGSVLESAGRMEQTEAFLSMNLGADQAKKTLKDIRSVTDELPGDDVALQNLLSQAAMKDTTVNFQQMGNAAANYMAAMQNFGKTSTETQQDLMNYILAGNTAEIERSPILQAHIDKLKEGNSIQERSLLLQEALNEEGWMNGDVGIANQELYNNKLQTFNDMLERGKMNLGDVFLKGSEGAMDFLIKLDDSTNGLVGMGVALGGFATPLTDTLMGLGQMATGIKAIKDLGFIKWLKDLELFTKLSTAATWLQTQAQAALDLVMSANPIVLVVLALVALAAALIWAYYNVDWFREMVDNAFATLMGFAQQIYGYITGAIQWLGSLFNQFTSQLGLNTNDWLQAVLGFILFIPQLPMHVGIALVNTIAKVLGFGDNFVQKMTNSAMKAINGFKNYIIQLPGIVMGEFNRVLGLVNDFINSLPSRVWEMGVAIIDALKKSLGIGSPGHMFYMVEGEFNRIEDLTEKTRFDTGSIGQSMVDSFNMDLDQNGGISPGGGNSQVINLYIDNVNDEKYIDMIIEKLTRALAFDNKTAGRTV